MTVMGWMELPEEDQPPQHIWLNDEALNDHFEAVKQRRNSGGDRESVPDLDQNELTRGLR